MSRQSDSVFARIARRYDRINRVLSLGRERVWRQSAIDRLPDGVILDIGAGTGDAGAAFEGRRVIELDPVVEMLALGTGTRRVVGLGERLPLAGESVDGVFSAYVVRNLDSLPDTLGEVHRVLKPGGTATIIDLGRPRNRWAALLHRLGTAIVLPLVGLLFARAPREYWYLHRSLDKLAPVETLYSDGPLEVAETWRMGFLGFVYGVELKKAR